MLLKNGVINYVQNNNCEFVPDETTICRLFKSVHEAHA